MTERCCVYCKSLLPDERPYDHCTQQTCVDTWLVSRRSNMGIALLHKQGFEVVFRDKAMSTPAPRGGTR